MVNSAVWDSEKQRSKCNYELNRDRELNSKNFQGDECQDCYYRR